MKAWWIWFDDEWGDYVHGETVSKAKAMFWATWSWEADEWIRLRAKRVPRLDDKPITMEAILEVDHYSEGDLLHVWYPICTCEICK